MVDNSRHKARQQRLKEQVDARIAAAQQDRGLLVVITGDGKGKSTSGFGTVCRAVPKSTRRTSPRWASRITLAGLISWWMTW